MNMRFLLGPFQYSLKRERDEERNGIRVIEKIKINFFLKSELGDDKLGLRKDKVSEKKE